MYYPTLEQIKEIIKTGDYNLVPVCKEMYGDSITPIEVMRILKKHSKHCYMLESVDDTKRWSRYTFMGYDPKSEITCLNNLMNVDGKEFMVTHPKDYLKKLLKQYQSPKIAGLPTFTGGLVGYFAYDYFKYSEPVLNLKSDDKEGFNDVDLMLFDQVICFDNYKQKIVLIANVAVDDLEKSYHEALVKLEKMQALIISGVKAKIEPLRLKSDFKALFEQNEYCNMVERAKKYIKEGDIFQVVLSNCLEAEVTGSLFDTYRVLRTTNPSPYMFYFFSDDQEFAGASPETLVKLEDKNLYTYPLAGTRPRGMNENEDVNFEVSKGISRA